LPPLSGFIGKVLILHSAGRFAEQMWAWPALLTISLVTMIAYSRVPDRIVYFFTAPITANMLAKAALYVRRRPRSDTLNHDRLDAIRKRES
jgi:formate hydrogenlyase subunit 3/multisubunit Na+/H+ antiporter MnhD subunit